MKALDAIDSPDSPDTLARAERLVVAGELVSAITHDLRQPLTAIEMDVAAAVRLLEQQMSDPDAHPRNDRITHAIAALHDALAEQARMREALQVLQDLAAQREPSFGPLDLGESVRDAVHLLASDAIQRHVRIDVTCAPTLPAISADVTLVRQAMLNILLEALDGTSRSDRSERPISIDVHPYLGTAVDVVVSHYGPSDDVALDVGGLALARSVAHAHGATLEVTGDARDGITVCTRWPLLKHGADAAGGTGARE